MQKIALWGMITWIGLPFLAHAQITYGGCTDARGIAVASVRDYSIDDIAMAMVTSEGIPIIRYNPRIVESVRPQTRLFFYTHECGHHALAHVLTGLRMGQEQEADCWSIRTLVDKGLVTDSDITLVQRDLAARARGDWTHLPGPQRAINLRVCLNGGASEDQGGPQYQTVMVPCTHLLHPLGDALPCTHALHVNGDAVPCQHPCPGPYGPVRCHQFDAVPCTHVAHPLGDLVPCSHLAHPDGDPVQQRVR